MSLDVRKFESFPQPRKEVISSDLFNMTADLMKKTQELKLGYETKVNDYLRREGLLVLDVKDGRIAELESQIRMLKAQIAELEEKNIVLKLRVQELESPVRLVPNSDSPKEDSDSSASK